MATDICINIHGGKFNYRVGTIILHDGKLLMAKNSGDNHYYTIGGRVKFGESAEETILREALEETGLPLEVDRLAFIHENFFTFTPSQEHFHEICRFFVMKTHDKLSEIRQPFSEEYGEVSIHWLPINKLDEYEIYPEFFKTMLDGGTYVRHIVTHDDKII